jgi:hypothetical protein
MFTRDQACAADIVRLVTHLWSYGIDLILCLYLLDLPAQVLGEESFVLTMVSI